MSAPRDTPSVPDRTEDIRAVMDKCASVDSAFVDRWPNPLLEDESESTREGQDLLDAEWSRRNGGVR